MAQFIKVHAAAYGRFTFSDYLPAEAQNRYINVDHIVEIVDIAPRTEGKGDAAKKIPQCAISIYHSALNRSDSSQHSSIFNTGYVVDATAADVIASVEHQSSDPDDGGDDTGGDDG